VPYLLHLFCVTESGTFDHLTNAIIHALLCEGGLSHEQIASSSFALRLIDSVHFKEQKWVLPPTS
jgi:hypothetical protein